MACRRLSGRGDLLRCGLAAGRRRWHQPRRQLEAETGTLVRHAGAADGAAHQFHQVLADGQAQARAAVAVADAAVGLAERLEQVRLRLRANADAAVGDRVAQPPLPGVHAGVRCDGLEADADGARRGELDGVVEQVAQHLAHPRRIAFHEARQAVHIDGDAQLLAFGAGAVQRQHLVDQLGRCVGLPFELHVARFDLGKIEHVVDDVEQFQRGLVHIAGVGALGGVEPGIEHQFAHADDAVHRRADLVAGHGQKARLGGVGGVGVGLEGQCLARILLAALEQEGHQYKGHQHCDHAGQDHRTQHAQVVAPARQQQVVGDGGVDDQGVIAHHAHGAHAGNLAHVVGHARTAGEHHVVPLAGGDDIVRGAAQVTLAHHGLAHGPARQQREVAAVQRDGGVLAQAHVAEKLAEEIARHAHQDHAGKAAGIVVQAPAYIKGPGLVALVAHRGGEEWLGRVVLHMVQEVVAVGQVDGRRRVAAGKVDHVAVGGDDGGHADLRRHAHAVAQPLVHAGVAEGCTACGRRRACGAGGVRHQVVYAVEHLVGGGHGLGGVLGQYQGEVIQFVAPVGDFVDIQAPARQSGGRAQHGQQHHAHDDGGAARSEAVPAAPGADHGRACFTVAAPRAQCSA